MVKEVHFDYMFMGNKSGGHTVPVIVGRCRSSKLLIAHVVPMKGDGEEWIAKQVVKDIKKMGHYGPLIVKSDGEPALLSLLEKVAVLRDRETAEDQVTVLEESPVGDSKGNGFAERAVQQLEEILRVHKLALETTLQGEIEVDHCAVVWLVDMQRTSSTFF